MAYVFEKRRVQLEWHGYDVLSVDNVDRVGVPHRAGVYKLATKKADGNLTVFYVGQAEDLNARLKVHASGSDNECVRKKVRTYTCYFSYALVARAEDRDGAERALYLFFRPECNDPDRIPAGPEIEINPKNS